MAKMISFATTPEPGAIGKLLIVTMWRNAQHLHFIRASDAISVWIHATISAMSSPDLNLLVALDVLLTEGSVARAAGRLRLSPSAMSRTLARLRETFSPKRP